jgi:endo-1,4-beta-xylanase
MQKQRFDADPARIQPMMLKHTPLILCTITVLLSGVLIGSQGADRNPMSKSTLKSAFGRNLKAGVAISNRYLSDPKYVDLIKTQFNCVTAENEMKPASMLVAPGKYDFTAADQFMDFAKSNKLEVIGHTLVWHSQSPAFLYQDSSGKPLSREVALKNMRDHIFAVVGRYKGKVKGWDVVNEAIADSGGLRKTPALLAIGEDYIQKAFEFAAEADPKAELYYNDYNIDLDYKRPSAMKLVKSLRDSGVKLSAVGVQGHYMTTTSLDEVKRGLQEYIDAGFKLAITELDVDPLPRQGGSGADVSALEKGGLDPYKNGMTPEAQSSLANWYGKFFEFVKSRPQIQRITFWGVSDAHTWLNGFPVRGRTNHPLLFDRNYEPKPAFFKVIEAMTKPPRKNPISPDLKWTTGAEVIGVPKDEKRPVVSIKDPTIVKYKGRYHMFATVARPKDGWQMVYMNFKDWKEAATATPYYLDELNPSFKGYRCAPQVFWFEPEKQWYLIFQAQQPQYSTTKDIADPKSWSAPKDFFAKKPTSAPNLWIDYFIICDKEKAFLFFTGDDGKLYRSETKLADFPNKMTDPVIVMQGRNAHHLFEASAHYKIKGTNQYLTIIEAIGPNGIRYYRGWTAEKLDGEWTPLADTWEKPFAGIKNVEFKQGTAPWTEDISHGELIRDGYNQEMVIDPKNLVFLFQGRPITKEWPDYLLLPYRLGVLELKKN